MLTVLDRGPELRVHIGAALNVGVTSREIEELIISYGPLCRLPDSHSRVPGTARDSRRGGGMKSAKRLTQIAASVFVTRLQAVERLGITPARFDALRKRAGIRHAQTERGDSGWPMYLCRQSDVDRLREAPARDGAMPR